ncbi:MAG: hypothetical protein LCH78_03060 [Proteobacteria bacterium]|nr:hypothetical protein [Pseudomonadota bacterium]
MSRLISRRALLATVSAPVALGLPSTALAASPWLKAESRSFALFGNEGEKTLREMARDLEDFDGLLRTLHGMGDAPPARRLPIYLAPSRADFKRVRPGDQNISGFFSAGVGEVFAVLTAGNDSDVALRVMFHEYAHHFMMQHAPAAYPSWLVEGYAEYMMTARFKGDVVEVGVTNPRIGWLRGQIWSPFETILGRRALTGERADISAFYAQAWILTHYMMSDPERLKRLAAYARSVAAGGDPVALFPQASGIPFADLEKTLKRYMVALPGKRMPRPPSSALNLTFTALPPSTDALILENQRLKMGVPTADRPALLALIRERASRFPGDRFAELTLARAENDFGDRAKAQSLLRGRIAADPTDVEALQILGWSCMLQARTEPAQAARWLEEARDHLAAAFKLDPDNPLVLYDYAMTRRGEPSYPSDNILNVLLKAQAIAPQVAAFRLGAVDGLVRRDRFEEAAVLLQPLINDPHAPPERVKAWRKQFDDIVARRKPAATSGGGDKDAVDG